MKLQSQLKFFHMNGCAPRLALRKRLKVIRKWPIQLALASWSVAFYVLEYIK